MKRKEIPTDCLWGSATFGTLSLSGLVASEPSRHCTIVASVVLGWRCESSGLGFAFRDRHYNFATVIANNTMITRAMYSAICHLYSRKNEIRLHTRHASPYTVGSNSGASITLRELSREREESATLDTSFESFAGLV